MTRAITPASMGMKSHGDRDKEKLLKRTSEALSSAPLLIVEGSRDERALRSLGFNAPVLRANDKPERLARRALPFVDSGGDVALLFDFDDEGERKLSDYRAALEVEGVRCDSDSRRRLKWLTGIKHIEDLPGAWLELEEKLASSRRAKR